MSELKMESHEDPLEYFSKMKFVLENVDKLKINANCILQYFVWLGLNENFRNILVSITNHTWPTLTEIKTHFFTACERYTPKTKKKEVKSTDMAVKVTMKNDNPKSKFFPCSLCSFDELDSGHPLSKCVKYFTTQSKMEKLKNINGCTKCAFTNHNSANCRFKFKNRCSTCQGYHWSFLCVQQCGNLNSKSDKTQIKNEKEAKVQPSFEKGKNSKEGSKDQKSQKSQDTKTKIQSGVTTVVEAHKINNDGETILPTFTCEVKGVTLRVMKDGGCQSNFISSDLADKFDLKVLDNNVDLTVNGINCQKNYTTKQVEVEMVLDGKTSKIKALCLPSINIVLELPGLGKLVENFMSKGYRFADKMLNVRENSISNINMIVGSKSSHVIPEREILFGREENSCYSQSPAGVLLKGDIQSLLNDINFLTDNNLEISSNVAISNKIIPFVNSNDNEQNFNSLNSSLKLSEFSSDTDGKISEDTLLNAANQVLENECTLIIGKETNKYKEDTVEVDNKLVQFTLENTTRNPEDRLVMPILWNPRTSHLLGKNLNLSKQILSGTLKKYEKDKSSLVLIDEVFKEQEKLGIIEKIPDLNEFISENPKYSFLPFMPVFRPERETTKCRVVFLSNLSEKSRSGKPSLSHNQAILPGPSLNQKLSSAIMQLRFGKYICIFDISKAFSQIDLPEYDRSRLLFLWFQSVQSDNYDVVAYRSCRLPFGLRCSPVVLMLALYKILIIDAQNDDINLKAFKNLIYQLSYMDNCAFTSESHDEFHWMFNTVKEIFSPYKFALQQFQSNDETLRNQIEKEIEENGKKMTDQTKLLGLQWDQNHDKLFTKPIELDENAKTKRTILSSIASQFDILGFNGPLMNRARIFMHELQIDTSLDWDTELSKEAVKEWRNIVKQNKSTPPLEFSRNFGSRNDKYELIAFTDSSKVLFGTVLYILNLTTNNLNFVLSRNKLVNKQLETKSIPTLELQAITLAVETVLDIKNELAGSDCINPISVDNISVYSDSFVALAWINSYSLKLEKQQKRNAFVLNRLEYITKLCEKEPITFRFVSGDENPADCVTRPISHKLLLKTNFICGPKFLTEDIKNKEMSDNLMTFTLPEQSYAKGFVYSGVVSSDSASREDREHLISLDRFSSFQKLARVYGKVLLFCNKLKSRIKIKNPHKFSNLKCVDSEFDFYKEACHQIILKDQELKFKDVFEYFKSDSKTIKNMPNLISQLNLYIDSSGIIRVKSKCERMKDIKKVGRYNFPILLSKCSLLCKGLVNDYHVKLAHAGCYTLLAEIRKRFWITHAFSTVKKIIKECTLCRRLNSRPIKINQSPYREFRINPDNIPYRQIFIDFLGPFKVKNESGESCKIWILCITCLWSRAINLKICMNLSTDEFLLAFQLHIYEHGMPNLCISDMGTQLVAGANVINTFIDDFECSNYLKENGIGSVKFDQYFKGHSQLGSIVESCVKLTKRLIYGSIKNNVLPLRQFQFIIARIINILNKRPIAFKESLRDTSGEEVPEVITPEMLLYGREIISLNIIPDLHPDMEADPEWRAGGKSEFYEKLCKIKKQVSDIYYDELIGKLIYQAIDKKDRYKPVNHKLIKPGDIVLLKETYSKPNNFPLAKVKDVVTNINGEVTGAIVIKGKTNEVLKRHSSTLVPLLTSNDNEQLIGFPKNSDIPLDNDKPKLQRSAAIKSRALTKKMLSS